MREDDRTHEEREGPTAAYDRTVDRLAAGLAPVAPVWSFGRRLAIWAAWAVALVVGSTIVTARPDLAAYLARSTARVEIVLLSAMLLWCGAVALRGAVPGGEPTVRTWLLTGLGIVLVALLGLLGPLDQTVSLGDFVARGVPCARMTLVLAGLAALGPLILAGRGFPLAPAATGAIAGLAGAIAAVLAMRLHCPVDETSHQLTFHASALLPVALTAALLAWSWQCLKTEG